MSFSVHLIFDGQCEKAFRFYEECFGAKIITMLKWSESSAASQAPPDAADGILHATLKLGDSYVFGADAFPGKYEKPQGFFVLFSVGDSKEAEQTFQKLADGGNVTMPLQETFWAKRYGVVTDKYGVSWEVNTSKPH
jgi:PhnB protein